MRTAGSLLLLFAQGIWQAQGQAADAQSRAPLNALSVLCEALDPSISTCNSDNLPSPTLKSGITTVTVITTVVPSDSGPTAASPPDDEPSTPKPRIISADSPWPPPPNDPPGDLFCGVYRGWEQGKALDLDQAKLRNDEFCGNAPCP